MKKIRIFTVLILIVCCKNSETKTKLQNTKIEINKNLIEKSLLFPFEKKLTEFQKELLGFKVWNGYGRTGNPTEKFIDIEDDLIGELKI